MPKPTELISCRPRRNRSEPVQKLYKRPDSRFWQCCVLVHGRLHHRSTGTIDEDAAYAAMFTWKWQLARRGKPSTTFCHADL